MFLLWNVVPHVGVQGWIGAMCLLQVLHLALASLYHRIHRLPKAEQFHTFVGRLLDYNLHRTCWDRWYLASVAASGLMWGAAGFALFPRDAAGHQLALSFALGSTVAASTAVLAALRPAFPLFGLSALLTLALRFFMEATPRDLMMGTLTPIVLLVLMKAARVIHATIASPLALRLENKDLVIELTAKADELWISSGISPSSSNS